MSQRTVAILVLAVGVLLFLVALAADGLGLGASPGLGWRQLAAATVGVALAVFGLVRMRRA